MCLYLKPTFLLENLQKYFAHQNQNSVTFRENHIESEKQHLRWINMTRMLKKQTTNHNKKQKSTAHTRVFLRNLVSGGGLLRPPPQTHTKKGQKGFIHLHKMSPYTIWTYIWATKPADPPGRFNTGDSDYDGGGEGGGAPTIDPKCLVLIWEEI